MWRRHGVDSKAGQTRNAWRKVSLSIGNAKIQGLDLALPIDNETFRQVEDAFYSYSVLVFRDQNINDDQHISFSRRFGPLEMSMVNDPSGGGGPINRLSDVDDKGDIIPADDRRMVYYSGNMLWHSDSSYKKVPARASLLFAIEVPPIPQILVRTIPETGEKTLFVGVHASHIIGWPVEKGRALLEELLSWTTQRKFVYRHQWRPKDLVMWDNRCCLHRGRPWNGAEYPRVMRRTTIAGEGPTI